MGGFTECFLKDTSQKNIDKHNKLLAKAGIPEMYHFYSQKDTKKEYKYFLKGDGVFPEHQFPKDKIKSYKDFRKYWSTNAIGACICPKFGTLRFDCYFGRTPDDVMEKIGKYIAENISEFKGFDGSFGTFMERGMTDNQRKIVQQSGLKY